MNSKVLVMIAMVTPLMFGCAKKVDEKAHTEATASAATPSATTSADQQAKIDALDKPVLDEKHTGTASTVTPSH